MTVNYILSRRSVETAEPLKLTSFLEKSDKWRLMVIHSIFTEHWRNELYFLIIIMKYSLFSYSRIKGVDVILRRIFSYQCLTNSESFYYWSFQVVAYCLSCFPYPIYEMNQKYVWSKSVSADISAIFRFPADTDFDQTYFWFISALNKSLIGGRKIFYESYAVWMCFRLYILQ